LHEYLSNIGVRSIQMNFGTKYHCSIGVKWAEDPVYKAYVKAKKDLGVVPTKETRYLLKQAKDALKKQLDTYVILATASKISTYYNMFLRNSEDVYRVVIDEAGMYPLLSYMSVLLLEVVSVDLFGDYMQLSPYDKAEGQYLTRLSSDKARVVHSFMYKGVMQYYFESGATILPSMECLRLAKTSQPNEGRKVVEFFYNNVPVRDYKWEIITEASLDAKETVYVPEAIDEYPYQMREAKEKEAFALNVFVKRVSMLPTVDPDKLTYIAVQKHLVKALKQNKAVKKASTVRSFQGSADRSIALYLPRMNTIFIEDKLFLVAVSRHYWNLHMSGTSFKALHPVSVIDALRTLDYLVPTKSPKTEGYSLSSRVLTEDGRRRYAAVLHFIPHLKGFFTCRKRGYHMAVKLRDNWDDLRMDRIKTGMCVYPDHLYHQFFERGRLAIGAKMNFSKPNRPPDPDKMRAWDDVKKKAKYPNPDMFVVDLWFQFERADLELLLDEVAVWLARHITFPTYKWHWKYLSLKPEPLSAIAYRYYSECDVDYEKPP